MKTLLNPDAVPVTGTVEVTNVAAGTTTTLSLLTYAVGGENAVNVTGDLTGTTNKEYAVTLPYETAADAAITVHVESEVYATAQIGDKEPASDFVVGLTEGRATLKLTITSEDGKVSRFVTINFSTEKELVTVVTNVPGAYTLPETVADAEAAIALLEKMDMTDVTLTANSGATLKLKWEYGGGGFDNKSGQTNSFTWTVVKEDGSAIEAAKQVVITGSTTVTNHTVSTDASLSALQYQIGNGTPQAIEIEDQDGETVAITVPALPFGTAAITLLATPTDVLAQIAKVEQPEDPAQSSLEPATSSFQVAINAEGNTECTLKVTAEDNSTTKTFTLTFSLDKEKVTEVSGIPTTYKLPEAVETEAGAIALLDRIEGVVIKTNGETAMKLVWSYETGKNTNEEHSAGAFSTKAGAKNVFTWTVKPEKGSDLEAIGAGVILTGTTTVTNYMPAETGEIGAVTIDALNPVDKIGDGEKATTAESVTVGAAMDEITFDKVEVTGDVTIDGTVGALAFSETTITGAVTVNSAVEDMAFEESALNGGMTIEANVGTLTLSNTTGGEFVIGAGATGLTLIAQGSTTIEKVTNAGSLTLDNASSAKTFSLAVETKAAALANKRAIKEVENNGVFTDNTASIVNVTGGADLAITTLPQSQSTTGSTVDLSVAVATPQNGTVSYQWQKSINDTWVNANGEGKDAATLKVAKTGDGAGTFRCEVKNRNSSVVTTLYTPSVTVIFKDAVNPGPDPVEPTPSTYTVTLPKVAGATFSKGETTTVTEGGDFSFTITLDKEYDQSKPVVKVGNATYAPDASGVYTIEAIAQDMAIEVSGIVKNMATGIEDITENVVRVWSEGSTLYIHTPEAAPVSIFSAAGSLQRQLKAVSGDQSLQLRAGFYLVRIGNYTAKVIIR